MPTYTFSVDGYDEDLAIGADCTDSEIEDKATDWVQDGEWEHGFVSCSITELDEDGDSIRSWSIEVEVGSETEEPTCEESEDGDHDWQAPYEIVGGCRENPGVWGLRGTQVTSKSICSCCGMIRDWISESTPGEYPREPEKTEYSDATEETLAWVESLKEVA